MTRKYGYCASQIHQNAILVFGTPPRGTVDANTTMVQEIVKAFENNYDKNNLTLSLPQVFKQITSKDSKLELVTTNTLCPINLTYSHNFVTRK